MADPPITGVPFAFFSSLVRAISGIKPKSRRAQASRSSKLSTDYPALDKFKLWVARLHSQFAPLPEGTTAICLRLLFPEDDIARKYDIQEPRMTTLLAKSFGLDMSKFEGWQHEETSGCLGDELALVLDKSCIVDKDFETRLSIAEVAELLDELAALSPYSHVSIHRKHPKAHRRSRADVMQSLFRRLSLFDATVVTQIILKDLRPLLYPLTELHYSAALVNFNTAAVTMLTKEHAMRAWNSQGLLPKFFRVRATFDAASALAEKGASSYRDAQPAIGFPIAVPKSEKGQSCPHALGLLFPAETVWAETKYDGERAQIHVKVRADGGSDITIFSKSRRESTGDRVAVHDIIRAALGLRLAKASAGSSRPSPSQPPKIKHTIILDAEMVAFCGDKIAEFYHISPLIGGVRGRRRAVQNVPDDNGDTDSDGGIVVESDFSLGLVFFDILYLEGKSLLAKSYTDRRKLLESMIYVRPGKAILAARYLVPSSTSSSTRAEDTLRWIFAQHLAGHEEGLVLKAAESLYNDYCLPWVKLKKDYIPGHGDCVDMVILGASWEKVRGRSLRAPPSVYTTFFIGALENKEEVQKSSSESKPRFHSYFTVAYGLNREQLEDLNFKIRSTAPVPFSDLEKGKDGLEFNVTFSGISKPTVILRTPLLVELFGAGFTKTAHSQYYELRFPRITKIHRPNERSWTECMSLAELNVIAFECVGREHPEKEMHDRGRAAWGEVVLPVVKSKTQTDQRMVNAYNKLAASEDKPLCRDKVPKAVCAYAVESPAPAPFRRGMGPLSSRTNIFQVEEPAPQLASPVPEKIKSPMQAATHRLPLTPPASSPPTSKSTKRPPPSPPSERAQKRVKVESKPEGAVHTPVPMCAPPSAPNAIGEAQDLPKLPEVSEATSVPANASDALVATQVPESTRALPDSVVAVQSRAPTCAPPDIELDSTYVHFARPSGRACASWRASKRSVERPVHSINSMLAGCGWTRQALEVRNSIEKGVIVIDECASNAEYWRSSIRASMAEETPAGKRRLEVLVYGCRSDAVLERFAA